MKYFKHFTSAADSRKVAKARIRYGADGYALYFYVLELIARDLSGKDGVDFELKPDAEVLGFNLRMDTERVEEVLAGLADIGLLERSNNGYSCPNIAKHLDPRLTKNDDLKAIIEQYNAEHKTEKAERLFIGSIVDQNETVIGYKIGVSENPWARMNEALAKILRSKTRSYEKNSLKTVVNYEITTSFARKISDAAKEAFPLIDDKSNLFSNLPQIDGLIIAAKNRDLSRYYEQLRDLLVVLRSGKVRRIDLDLDLEDIAKAISISNPYGLLVETLPGLDEQEIEKKSASRKTDPPEIHDDENEDNFALAAFDPDDEKESKKTPPCPGEKIREAFNDEVAAKTGAAYCEKLNEVTRKHLRARWKEDPKRQSLEWWIKFFRYLTESDWLSGKVDAGKGCYMLRLQWLVLPTNFEKCYDGFYHGRRA